MPWLLSQGCIFCFWTSGAMKYKYYFNITEFVKNILKDQDINYIYDVDLDTYTNSELFFSYRRSCHQKKDKYGCQFSAIMLK